MINPDIFIIALYLAAVVYNGISASKHVKSMSDFATGSKNYTSFYILATLSSSFIGGGFTSGLAEKTFSYGIIYVVALWGFSFKEILISKYIVPRMDKFSDSISVGDIMGKLYGKNAKVFTGIASVLICAGIAGAQFSACGYLLYILLDIDQYYGILIAAIIVILYSSLGGMKAVVANDTLHFFVLIISIPTVFILGTKYIGGFDELLKYSEVNFNKIEPWHLFMLFLSFFFGETLVPPYAQRLLIGKDLHHTANGTFYSGIISFFFFLIVGFIGIIASKINPSINPNLAFNTVIQEVMPIGLKGFAIAGMIAVLMSSADSFLNAASIAFSHDVVKSVYKPKFRQSELLMSKISNIIIGIIGAYFAIFSESVLDIILFSYNFWTPFILVPLVSGILGVKRNEFVFWLSASIGILTVAIFSWYGGSLTKTYDATLIGVAMNAIIFFLFRFRTTKDLKFTLKNA